MTAKTGFFLIPLLLGGTLQAAFEERPFSARSAALGEAMTAVPGGADALYYNPAALGFSSGVELLSSHTRLFSLSELSYTSLAVVWPTSRWGAWGVGYNRFGPSFYQEEEASVAHAVRISSRASVGYALKRSSIRLRRYGSASALGVDAGVFGHWHPKGTVGFCFRNANRPRFGASPEGPSQEMRVGLTFRPLEMFLTSLDMVKPVRGGLSYRMGEEVRLAPLLTLRFGVETSPNRYSVGTAFSFKGGRLDYALLSHPFLPEQHHVSFSMSWGLPRASRSRGEKEGLSALLLAGDEVHSPPAPQKVNINGATLKELDALPGIGPATARKILDYRARHGPFRRDVDLLKVRGLRRKLFLGIRPFITVGEQGENGSSGDPLSAPPDKGAEPVQPKP